MTQVGRAPIPCLGALIWMLPAIGLSRLHTQFEGSLASSGVPALDKVLAGAGYPDKSTVLVVGPPGIGKEALGYWFAQSGLAQGEFCLYVTRLSVSEVLQDQKGFGIEGRSAPFWMASEGGQVKYDVNDLAGLSFRIKEVLKQNGQSRMRVVIDSLSSLLMLNPPETIYKFLTQLFADIKQYDVVLLATLEEGMHKPEVLAAMQQLFDGVVEMRLYEEGLSVIPLLRVRKMRGLPPHPAYYNFSFTRTGMEVSAYGK